VADAAKASGILSAFFAGFILGNSNIPYKSSSTNLLDALSTIGNVVIFVLLGLLVSPSDFNLKVVTNGVLLFLILAFVARPITVAACTFFAKYSVKENVFISWSGLRGAVPIVLATYPAAAHIEGAKDIFNIVFFAVLLSLVIQGGTITRVADKLKLTFKARPRPKQVMELVNVNTEMELVEIEVDPDIYEGEAELSMFRLPAGTTITMVNRNDNIIAPTGTTMIKPGDILYVLVKAKEIGKAMNSILCHLRSDKSSMPEHPDWDDIELWR
jgi:cell volume regulation protein A